MFYFFRKLTLTLHIMKKFTQKFFIMLFLLLGSICSYAQSILYTDVDPDSTVSAAVGAQAKFYLDLDQNLAVDMVLTHWNLSATLKTISLECYIDNEVITDGSSGHYPKALNLDDMIDPNSTTWYDPSAPVSLNQTTSTDTVGNWQGVTDKYLGIRLKSTGEYFYGWIRLDVPALPTEFTIKDYACRNAAGVGILAGDITGISEEQEQDRYQIMVMPGTLIIKLIAEDNIAGIVNIVNLTGQTVYSGTLNAETTTISGINLNKGIYFLYLYFNNRPHTAKILYRY